MIPGVTTYHPREEWQDPKYPVFGPLDQAFNNDRVVIHYTAADNLIDGDPGEHADNLPAYMRAMQKSYVINRGYSLGYLFAVDWLGGVWQIRGWEYQSAANEGENATTWPILVLVDGDDPATEYAARSIRAIVSEAARRAGRAQIIVGHRQIGATSCPGRGLQRQVDDGTFQPSDTPEPEDDDMALIAYYVLPPSELNPNTSPQLVVVNASVRYRTNSDVDGIMPSIRFERATHGDQYETLLRTVKLA